MRISDWSSTCALPIFQHIACRDHRGLVHEEHGAGEPFPRRFIARRVPFGDEALVGEDKGGDRLGLDAGALGEIADHFVLERETPDRTAFGLRDARDRSEEHTSELQSLMRISYAVFCLKKKKNPHGA